MANPRRTLALIYVILAVGVGALWVRQQTSPQAPSLPSGYVYTVDRGGLMRLANDKTIVASAYAFGLDAAPVPVQIGEWHGFDFPLNLEAYTSLLPEALLNRAYSDPAGSQVAYTVVGSASSRKLHRPDICYQGAGWAITPLSPSKIALNQGSMPVNRFIAAWPGGERRLVLYWYLWHDERRRIEDGAFVMQVAIPLRPAETAEHLEVAEQTGERFTRLVMLLGQPA